MCWGLLYLHKKVDTKLKSGINIMWLEKKKKEKELRLKEVRREVGGGA